MKIQESAENYLETILIIKREKGSVRSIDVVHALGFSKPSISRAMSLLRENEYITMDKDGLIELTASGQKIAETMLERHEFVTDWLVHLGVSKETASEDACRIEHVISEETFNAIKKAIKTEK